MSELDPANRAATQAQLAGAAFFLVYSLRFFVHQQRLEGWANVALGCLIAGSTWYGRPPLKHLSRKARFVLLVTAAAATGAALVAPLIEQRLLGYAVLCAAPLATIVKGRLSRQSS
jgi:hypothetical protein